MAAAPSRPRELGVPGRLRIALIGAGRRGRAHAATISELPEWYELAAICDVDEARARALADTLASSPPKPYGHLLECLARENLDAVAIATPPETHHLVAKAAADARAHMLIETPLALTRAMMDYIAEAVSRAGVQVEVGENYGRRPAERLNRQVLEAGFIGKVLHVSAFNAPANHESAYHTMSLFRLYVGADVEEVQAAGQAYPLDRSKTGWDAETWVDAVLRFENGVTASCAYVTSWTAQLRWGRPRITTVEGSEGYVLTSDGVNTVRRLEQGAGMDYPLQVESREVGSRAVPRRFFYETTPAVEVANPLDDHVLTDVDPVGVCDGLGRVAELLALHRAVTEGVKPEHGIAQARRSQELGIAIAESARLGCPLAAKLGAETSWERDQHAALRREWNADPLKDVDLILKR